MPFCLSPHHRLIAVLKLSPLAVPEMKSACLHFLSRASATVFFSSNSERSKDSSVTFLFH